VKTAILVADQLTSPKSRLLSVPGAFFLVALIAVLLILAPFSTTIPLLNHVLLLVRIGFGLGSTISNIWFLVVASQQENIAVYWQAGTFFLCLTLLVHMLYSLYVTYLHSKVPLHHSSYNRQRIELGAFYFLSLFDLRFLFLSFPKDESSRYLPMTMKEILLIGSGCLVMYQSIPLFVVESLSTQHFSPMITLIAIGFNLGMILLFIGELVVGFFKDKKESQREGPKPKEEDKDISMVSPSSSQQDAAASPSSSPLIEHAEGTFTWILVYLCAPLVGFSLVPQMATMIGLPFALRCLFRFSYSAKVLKKQESQLGKELSWIEKKGLFLVPLNLVSLVLLMVVILPWISLVGLMLLAYQTIDNLFRPGCTLFKQYRSSVHALVGSLAFGFLPIADEPPRFRISSIEFNPNISWWVKIGAIAWFLGLEVGLPIADIVTDVLFSLELLDLSRDPLLGRKDDLVTWMIVSFVATGGGILFEALKLLLEGIYLFERRKEQHSLIKFIFVHSPFGVNASKRNIFTRLASSLFENVLQILVAVQTVSFVSQVGGLWGFKLAISIIAVSYSLAKAFTIMIFGAKITREGRVGLQGSYFIMFGLAISLLAGLLLQNNYCGLSRTVDTPSKLIQVGRCPQLSEPIVVREMAKEAEGSLQFSQTSNFSVEANLEALWLEFLELEGLEKELPFLNNSDLTVSLPRLEEISSSGVLLFEGNEVVREIDLPFLFSIGSRDNRESRNLILKDNDLIERINLESLFQSFGELYFENSHFEELYLPSLTIAETITITKNDFLRSFRSPSLNRMGRLEIQNCSVLEEIQIPRVESMSLFLRNLDNLEFFETTVIETGTFRFVANPSSWSQDGSNTWPRAN